MWALCLQTPTCFMSHPLAQAVWGWHCHACMLLAGLCLDWGLNWKGHQGQQYMCRWSTPSNKQLHNSNHESSMMLGPGMGEELKMNEIHCLPLRSSHSLSGWPRSHLYVICYYLLSIQKNGSPEKGMRVFLYNCVHRWDASGPHFNVPGTARGECFARGAILTSSFVWNGLAIGKD